MISFKSAIIVGVGGFFGTVLRFQIGAYFLHSFPNAKFPWATLLINISGCFLVGLIAGSLERTQFHNAELRLLLITGFLGGFTTFSAFGLETLYLLRQQLVLFAALNIGTSVCVGLLAAFLGLRCGPLIARLLS